MSNDEKVRVNLVNRPSQRRKHSAEEWSKHIELTESEQVKRDIVSARQRLGQFSARFVVEAICSGEPDGERLAQQMLTYFDDPDQLIDELDVDPRALKKLAQNVGGKRAERVVQNSVLREIPETTQNKNVSDRQVELLRELLKTMDPDVVKRALLGD